MLTIYIMLNLYRCTPLLKINTTTQVQHNGATRENVLTNNDTNNTSLFENIAHLLNLGFAQKCG